ncbi:MAG: glycosyltransferase [Solobacterium sp.]|nr:glycosyltransferase [Solobacterium sp.]
MSYLVTIVIPTYKRADRITRAVESCLKQTCPCEIIVVDDNGRGSEDQLLTEQALRPYIEADQVIYLVNEVNSRASFSRNQGLNAAKGKYITFLDDDDEISPRKLEKQADLLEELGEEYSCCYTNYHKILEGGKTYTGSENVSGYVYPYALARVIYNGSGSNLLARTETAKEIGGYDISFAKRQDMEFMARLLKNYKLAYVDEDLFTIHYEIRENKLTYEGLSSADEHWIEVFRDEIDALPAKQRDAVYQSLALERWRYSIPRHMQKDAFANMKKYHVTFPVFVRYVFYLIDRVVGKKSYGVKLIKL